MSRYIALQMKDEGDEDWSTLNKETLSGETKSEMETLLKQKQERWRATVYPQAMFRIVEV